MKSILSDYSSILGRFIGGRERAPVEVELHLRKKGLDQATIEQLIASLKEEGILDEYRFAMNRLEYRISQGYGVHYIKNELSSLRINREVIDALMSEDFSEDFQAHAVEQAEQRLQRYLTAENAAEKIQAFLTRRGFTKREIDEAMKSLKENYPHWARRQWPSY